LTYPNLRAYYPIHQDYALLLCDAIRRSSKSKPRRSTMAKRGRKHKLTVKGAHLGMKHKGHKVKGRKRGGKKR